MSTYECVKSFYIPIVDGDGFHTDKEKLIGKGTKWCHNKETNIIGGEIHLEGEEKFHEDGIFKKVDAQFDKKLEGGETMFAIKNVKREKFARHTGETINNEGVYYVEYPWELVDEIEKAQQYTTLEHANEIATWHLDHSEEWVIVDVETGKEYEKSAGKYIPF